MPVKFTEGYVILAPGFTGVAFFYDSLFEQLFYWQFSMLCYQNRIRRFQVYFKLGFPISPLRHSRRRVLISVLRGESRRIWYNEERYFSVVDVVEALTDSPTPRQYWGN